MLDKFDQKIIKIFFGFFCGVIVFGLVANLVGRIFEKSDEQIAKENCEKAKKLIGINGSSYEGIPFITTSINGKTYKCN